MSIFAASDREPTRDIANTVHTHNVNATSRKRFAPTMADLWLPNPGINQMADLQPGSYNISTVA